MLELSRTIYKVNRIMTEYWQQLMEQEDLGDLQPTIAAVLLPLLEKEGRMLSELAGNLRMKAPTVTVIANRLEELGWIRRERGTEDRRQVHLFLTEEGREKAKILGRIRRKVLQHMAAGIGKDRLVTANKTLNQILSNVDGRLS